LTARPPKKPTPERLANIALYYLSRYAASEAGLRRVLENRVRRYVMKDEAFAADPAAQAASAEAITKIIEGHKASGVLNDAAFAEMKVHSLRRAGRSARRITQQLTQKGVPGSLIVTALEGDGEESPEVIELRAAQALAKRRGFGPYRKGGATADRALQNKEVASMARAGFSFDVIQKVIKADLSEEAFEA